jgi:hypothetical protein
VAHSYGGKTNLLFKRKEQTKHGLVDDDEDDKNAIEAK